MNERRFFNGIFQKRLTQSPEGKYERKEQASDAERVADVVFWTYQIGQGSAEMQRKAYNAMLANDPSLSEAVIRYHKSAPGEYAGEPQFEATLEKIRRYTTGVSHARPVDVEQIRNSLLQEYQNLVRAAFYMGAGEKPLEHHRDDAFKALVTELIIKDIQYASAIRQPLNARMQVRKNQGGSFIMVYALSKNREQNRAHLPPELQRLWEDIGLWIRANFKKLHISEQNDLKNLKRIYQELTSDTVTL
jgi:hypothetical protein